jgi:hypothetical protein
MSTHSRALASFKVALSAPFIDNAWQGYESAWIRDVNSWTTADHYVVTMDDVAPYKKALIFLCNLYSHGRGRWQLHDVTHEEHGLKHDRVGKYSELKEEVKHNNMDFP